MALRILVAKVTFKLCIYGLDHFWHPWVLMRTCFLLQIGTADVLAFFLPGVVSQVFKVLHVSRAMISGAAGSVDALDQAIRGLAEFLMIVLEDEANSSALEISNGDTKSQKHESAHSILDELRSLTTKSQGQSDELTEITNQEIVNINVPEKSNLNLSRDSFLVERTKKWLDSTTSHVNKLLCETFPHVSYLFSCYVQHICPKSLWNCFF